MKPRMALAMAGVAVVFGLVLGATVFSSDSATAQESTSTTGDPNATTPNQRDANQSAERAQRIRDLLQALVDDGTITATQADAVAHHLAASDVGPRFGDSRQHRLFRAGIAEASKVIGIEPQALVAELRKGRTIAEVANDHGVTPQAVIDSIVAAFNTHVDEAVTNGRIDAAHAGKLKEEAPNRIENFVNGVHGEPRSA